MGYTDLTAVFNYKSLLTHQYMDALAENDADVHLAGGTVMAFFQASAPTGWIIQAIVDDTYIRVVDGAGGGNGGDTVLSTGFSDQDHTHTTPGHTHSIPVHTHILQHATVIGSLNVSADPVVAEASSGDNSIQGTGGGLEGQLKAITRSNGSGTTDSESLTPSTNSGFSDIQYADVIVCVKGV